LGLDARWIDAVPQGVMKSFSGGGARALMLDTFKVAGPDSFAGHLSSIVQGASDTTFYILAACAAAAKLKNLGHAVIGSLVADGVSFVAAVALAQGFFG
jgi:spore maturation protein SpmB